MLTATNYNYSYKSRGRVANLLAPILPDSILSKLPGSGGGGFGFGPNGATNLVVITHHLGTKGSSIGRLRVVSDGTNLYDACWGAHTLGMPGAIINGWQLRAFPRRAKNLTLEYLAKERDGSWAREAVFEIANPAWGTFPQWTLEPFPAKRTNGNLAVTLARFRSGAAMETGNAATAPRKTDLLFEFAEDGAPTENWRVQKLIISDATGNNWFPYLDLMKKRMNWARGGQVEFFGALWPGEDAWKLDVEVVRADRFPSEDLVTFELPLPKAGLLSMLTNEWTHDGVTLRLKSFASPEVDHPGSSKWIGKWWGEDKGQVYSLVVELAPDLKGQRLSLVTANDEAGESVPLLQHGGQDYKEQAFFFKPG